MQVVLVLNYKNPSFPDSSIPYFFLPVKKDGCILDATLDHLSQQLSLEKVIFLVHKEQYTEEVGTRLEAYGTKYAFPCITHFTEVYNSPLYAEEALVENEPVLVMDATVLYTHLAEFCQTSSAYLMSQLYTWNREEVGVFYFQNKQVYLDISLEDIPLVPYIEQTKDSITCLNTYERYCRYIQGCMPLRVTPFGTEFRYSLTETCQVIVRMVVPGTGFRLESYSMAILLEGSVRVMEEEISCSKGTMLAGRGVFVANEASIVCVIDDQSIPGKEDFCGLIEIAGNFPSGWIVSEQPPSMVYTKNYDVYLQETGKHKQDIYITEYPELYIVYQGTFSLQNQEYDTGCIVEVPQGTCLFASWKENTKYLRIRKKLVQ